ncbi:hypothetical protein DXG03_009696 [Asterophora parasitica]|uniref:Uncharacterized protein n=1 Tax=Asterophora parasitica TaxID=117018 RepID=A0A9P7K8T8_9AGAR|nr:hypothetical protein DXG03_009696 [Asterophora parasitica]
MIHGDVSFGNIVLNDELYADDKQCVRIRMKYKYGVERLSALIRRAFVDIGYAGGLHDLDMAAYIPSTLPQLGEDSYLEGGPYAKPEKSLSSNVVDKQKANNEKPRPDFRTGTTPFMSIPLLAGGQNSLYDDEILGAFHESLWRSHEDGHGFIHINPRHCVQPESVIASLNEVVEQYRKDLEV